MRPEAVCDCQGPPWPPMTRLHVPGRYFICPHCKTVRKETTWTDGTIREVTYHQLDDGTLTKTIINAARKVLQPLPVQLELFEV